MAGVAVLAAVVRASVLFDDAFAHGYDGYYYVLQVRSLLAGQPLFDDGSAVFWLLAAVGWLLSDVVVGNKLVVCALGAAGSVGAMAAAWRWWSDRWAALVVGLMWACSPLHLAVSSEFVKNAAGLVMLAWLVAALARSDRSTRRMVGCIVLALLGLTVHKLTGVFGVVLTAAVGMTWLPSLPVARRRLAAVVAVVGVVVVAAGASVLRVVDFARFVSGLTRVGDRAAPFVDGRLVWGEKLALLGVYGAIPVVLTLAWRRRHASDRGLWWGMSVWALACTAPGLPMGYDLTAWRLALMGFVAVSFALGAVSVHRRWLGAVAVGVALVQLPFTVAARREREPDYTAWGDRLPVIEQAVSPTESLVAHRGLCGMLWAETGRRCENFQPTGDVSRWWRVTYGFGTHQLQPYGPVIPLAPGYLLVREVAYQQFAAQHDYTLLRHPLNPYEVRPGFVYGPRGEP